MHMEGSNEPLVIKPGFTPLKIFGHRIQQAIMPIIALAEDEVIPLGTGFVISHDGFMLTARHVVEGFYNNKLRRKDGNGYCKNAELYALYVTNSETKEMPGTTIGGMWPIGQISFHEGLDICYLWLREALIDGEPYKFKTVLKLGPGNPLIGEKILGFGYYKSDANYTGKRIGGKTEVKYKHDTAFTSGTVEEVYYPMRDKTFLNFPCFRTSARFDPGMSGGPVFNESGSVCGVICSSFDEGDEADTYISYCSLIWPSLAISVEAKTTIDPRIQKISIYEAIKNGYISADKSFKKLKFTRDGEKVSLELLK